jgi:chromatin remodeling complex protein RSC6
LPDADPEESRHPKNALSKPVQPDAALAAVVGKDPLPRTELTKRLWEYIRKHELQDPKDKRSIRADEKLLAVFDGKKIVSMFEMTKLVNGHLLKQGGL